jgi:peptide chain release factor 1
MTGFLRPSILAKLAEMAERLEELTTRVSDPAVLAHPERLVPLRREMGALQRVNEQYQSYTQLMTQIEGNKSLLEDPELAEEARDELPELEARAQQVADGLINSLLVEAGEGGRNAIVEIRAGAGGEEAALFARDLAGLYQRFAERMKWKVEPLSVSEAAMGGVKEIVLLVTGRDVFQFLRFESGGHRVQRVPETESQGRIHTSAATVAVLPQAEEVEVNIDDKDLRIDTYRASGAGGQHVNKTDSAVRITHEPTGIVVSCQQERSQLKNKNKAMKLLRTRLYDAEKQKREQARAADRRSQVGSGDRSMRIRTYNFPQDRLTDHRIRQNYPLAQVMEGKLEPVIEALMADERERRLQEL